MNLLEKRKAEIEKLESIAETFERIKSTRSFCRRLGWISFFVVIFVFSQYDMTKKIISILLMRG